MQVEVDITKPLSRGRWVRLGLASEGWVLFWYEHHPIFCCWCGRLTHDAKDCNVWIHSKGMLNVQNQPFGDWMRAPQTSMSRRKVISVAGQKSQRMGSSQENRGSSIPRTTQTMVDDGLPSETRVESSTRMERQDFQEFTKFGDMTKFTKILRDNEKFLAHIKEIDIALDHNPDISVLTNTLDNDNDCRTADLADIELTDMNSGGPILGETLDQGPSAKALSCSGPMNNNPNNRTWKRITMG